MPPQGLLRHCDGVSNTAVLEWFEYDTSVLEAKGSYVNTAIEDNEQRILFWVGLYIGVVCSFLPMLFTGIWRSGRSLLTNWRQEDV